jgi:chorismate mutase/prephenate dehydratase
MAAKSTRKKTVAKAKPEAPMVLADVRERIDGIDQQIQALIAERAKWAQQVGKAKGPLKAAVEYYRPEREAQVLRRVLDRNAGPLSDDVLLRLFREIMSACLAQQEPLKIGFLGPEGTFSQQAVFKHFGHSAHGLPLASIEEVFQEVEASHADFGVVPVENSGQGTIQWHHPVDAGHVSYLELEDLRRNRITRAPAFAVAHRSPAGHRTGLLASAVAGPMQGVAAPALAEGGKNRRCQ